MRVLLKPAISREMGIVLLKPGKHLMSLFASGRVLVEMEPANMAHLPSGEVPPAHQPLIADPALAPFFSNEKVIAAAGRVDGIEYWLRGMRAGCQWPHSDYHHSEMVTLRYPPAAVRLCWSCDNQLREQSLDQLSVIARNNAAEYIIRAARGFLHFRDDHELTLPELCWWAFCRNVLSAVPGDMARKALQLPVLSTPDVMRESDIVPSVPATSILVEHASAPGVTALMDARFEPVREKPVVSLIVDPVAPKTLFRLPKRSRWENPKFLAWVKTQPCACCGNPADDPHHLIGWGQGGTGTKAHDAFTIPLCRQHHDELHGNAGVAAFERKYGTQPELIIKLLDRALALGVLA
ncbi:Uncharacterized protein, YdfU family [Kosakonia radicincitans]|uniref:DUF968 domain-containing protein n=1 Tax=Kosakonia radicincitans TaxID=283686 RepID=UPI0011840D59|nr:DUF968 domain-containing protein [Kosakonia radicincitans]VVT52221.1 Uncharacterized protein, YdfU family [Kosakonia radicincitans]